MSMSRLCNPTHTKLPMRNILDCHLIALMKTRYIEQVPSLVCESLRNCPI